MFNHENLKGRVAVVTGGGGVLCGGFAKTLAAQGCKVAVLDLNEAAAQAVADEIKRLKPSTVKGRYITKATITSTMGPGIPLDTATLA